MSSPTLNPELDVLLDGLKDILEQKLLKPRVDKLMVPLRTCAEGDMGLTQETIKSLLQEEPLGTGDRTTLVDGVVNRIYNYQLSHNQ